MKQAVIAVALGVAGFGAAFAMEAEIELPWDDPARVAEGEMLFAENCASCHGENRQGGTLGDVTVPPLDETGHATHHGEMHLFMVVRDGAASMPGGNPNSPMTGFGEFLSDEEILSVLAYIKASWPEDVRMAHDSGHTH